MLPGLKYREVIPVSGGLTFLIKTSTPPKALPFLNLASGLICSLYLNFVWISLVWLFRFNWFLWRKKRKKKHTFRYLFGTYLYNLHTAYFLMFALLEVYCEQDYELANCSRIWQTAVDPLPSGIVFIPEVANLGQKWQDLVKSVLELITTVKLPIEKYTCFKFWQM